MRLMKNWYQPLKTERGQVGWVTGFWFLILLMVVLYACFQLEIYRYTSRHLEDALTASVLAAAVIDVETYGRTHEVRIDSPELAYERFQKALRSNLNLREDLEPNQNPGLTGGVQILNFSVINVREGKTQVYCYQNGEHFYHLYETQGNYIAPNQIPVESTAVYGEIICGSFGLFGVELPIQKKRLVDIVNSDG